MFKTDLSNERQLFAFTFRDLVPEDSDIWLYVDLFDALNLDDFSADYSPQGEEGLDPRVMLRTVFYGLTHGVASGRKLAAACRFDCRYVVLCGARQPHFRTFHRFLVRHEQRMTDLFVQVVRLAQKMNLVSLGRLAIDGTKIKGHTSQSRRMAYGQMDRAIAHLKREIAALRAATEQENAETAGETIDLPTEIRQREKRLASIEAAKAAVERDCGDRKPSDKTQKSFNDLDCVALRGKGGFTIGYNGQIAVDEKHQIVVAAEICTAHNDYEQLKPMLDGAKDSLQQDHKEVLLDAGYQSPENIKFVEDSGAEIFVSLRRERSTEEPEGDVPQTTYEQVKPDGKGGYLCLAGKNIPIKSRDSHGRFHVKVDERFCRNCEFQPTCRLFARCGKVVQLPTEEKRLLLAKTYARSRTDAYKEVYRHRKAIVEPVFGNIKYNKSARLFLSGRVRATNWWKMMMTAHNIEKMIGRMMAGIALPV